MSIFDNVEASEAERAERRHGDNLVVAADVVMDRGFSVHGTPDDVWPWIVQLGKWRAGWYLSRRIERFVPPGRRAIRRIDPKWQKLTIGDVIPTMAAGVRRSPWPRSKPRTYSCTDPHDVRPR